MARRRPSLTQLERFGFEGFVGDMFDGPDAVKAHMYMNTSVFFTPVFSADVENPDLIGETFPGMRRYYIGKTLRTVKKSKYSNHALIGHEDISYFKPSRLAGNADQDEIARKETELKEIHEKLKDTAVKQDKIDVDMNGINSEMQIVKKSIDNLASQRGRKGELEARLSAKQHLLEELENPDVEADKKIENYKKQKMKMTVDLSTGAGRLADSHNKYIIQTLIREKLLLRRQQLDCKFPAVAIKEQELEQEVSELKLQFTKVSKEFDEEGRKLRHFHSEAIISTSDEKLQTKIKKGEEIEDKTRPPLKYEEIFATSDFPSTVEALEAYIDNKEKDLEHAKSLCRNSERVEEQYQTTSFSIDNYNTELKNLRDANERDISEREMLELNGVTRLNNLIDSINDRFCMYFSQLGYSGEVNLDHNPQDRKDYKSYGISIKVKFGDGDSLTELSRGQQSGGEKSVTTAVYMLSLQAMTTVPFRCVDEINQGLDEQNERKVWDMILENSTKGSGSQYFYLAPKMPYNLQYTPGTMVHICQSSDTIQSCISSDGNELSPVSKWVTAARRTCENK